MLFATECFRVCKQKKKIRRNKFLQLSLGGTEVPALFISCDLPLFVFFSVFRIRRLKGNSLTFSHWLVWSENPEGMDRKGLQMIFLFLLTNHLLGNPCLFPPTSAGQTASGEPSWETDQDQTSAAAVNEIRHAVRSEETLVDELGHPAPSQSAHFPLNVQAQTPLLCTGWECKFFFPAWPQAGHFLDQNKSNNCSEWLRRSETAGKLCAFLLLVCIPPAVGQKYKRLSRTDYLALALNWSQIDRARYSSLVGGVKKKVR